MRCSGFLIAFHGIKQRPLSTIDCSARLIYKAIPKDGKPETKPETLWIVPKLNHYSTANSCLKNGNRIDPNAAIIAAYLGRL